MLKNIDPILTAPLLSILKEMGHGDEIVIVDTNFPAYSVGQRVVHMPGLDAPRVLEAVLSLMPLDDFVDSPAATMRPIDPKDASAIFDLFQRACDKAEAQTTVGSSPSTVSPSTSAPPRLTPSFRAANAGSTATSS